MSEYCVSLGMDDRKVIQSTEGYAFSQDSVLCANLMKAGPKDRLADLGCGGGIMGILALVKKDVKEVVGFDNDPYAVNLAVRNTKLNGLCDRMRVEEVSVTELPRKNESGTFDKIVCNPPYYDFDDGNATCRNFAARREGQASLEDFVRAGAGLLRFGGDFTLVMKVTRLADAVALFRKYSLEPKTVTFVLPKPDRAADIFVMTAKKGAAAGLKAEVLVVEDGQGNKTEAYKELYS